jgi:fatty-acyl-CoA synthase
MPYVGAMVGAKLVLPGPSLQPTDVLEAVDAEGITFSAGVPTLWNGVAALAESSGRKLAPLERVICAGSAVPAPLVERFEALGVELRQAWGMTEVPLGTAARVKQTLRVDGPAARAELLARQGLPVPTVEIRIVDAENHRSPRTARARGRELQVRG